MESTGIELEELKSGKKRRFQNIRRQFPIHDALPTWILIVFFAILGALYFVSYGFYLDQPKGLTRKDESRKPDRFIAEYASDYIKSLTDIGYRVGGSKNNEVHAVNFLISTVNEINRTAHPSHQIEMDHMKSDEGQFWRGNQVNVYRGLQNIVVKISPVNGDSPAFILMNSHFDTVSMSPGAGDDATMAGVMMEILRVVTKAPNKLKNTVVFLFNGCEEGTLSGSHAFLSQHKWFDRVRILINMDAAGVGGKELLFQTSPNHPWLMRYYRKAAPYQYANAIAEEVFQSGVIPSDTDYTNFMRFSKNIAGMDFAQTGNGYYYHTEYDAFDQINLGSLQHTGDNILALLTEIDKSPEARNVSAYARANSEIVFYDFLEISFIFYSETMGIWINVLVGFAVFALILWSLNSLKNTQNLTLVKVILECFRALAVQLISFLAAAFFVILLAVLVDSMHKDLFWFSRPWLIFGFYFSPFAFILMLGPYLYIERRRRGRIPVNYHVQAALFGHCFILILFMFVMTAMGIRSAFIFVVAAFFFLITSFVNKILGFTNKGNAWIYIHCLGQLLPVTYYCYLSLMVFNTVIPTTNRAYNGGTVNPEYFISGILILIGFLAMGFFAPLINMFRNKKAVLGAWLGIFLVSFILILTPLGFPFTEKTASQRYTLWHTSRTFYGYDAKVKHADSGIYVFSYDRLGSRLIKDIVPEMENGTSTVQECRSRLYCGMPFYLTRYNGNHDHGTWIPTKKPFIPKEPKISINNTQVIGNDVRRYSISMSGPDHMSLHISPTPGNKLVDWSFPKNEDGSMPDAPIKWYGDRDFYFIHYCHGIDYWDWKEYNFFFDIKVANWTQPYFVDIAHVAQYMNHDEYHNKDLKGFVKGFPKWANVQRWISSYKAYQI